MSVVKLEVCARQQSLTCPCAGQALLYAMALAASTAPPAASGDGLPGKGFGRRGSALPAHTSDAAGRRRTQPHSSPPLWCITRHVMSCTLALNLTAPGSPAPAVSRLRYHVRLWTAGIKPLTLSFVVSNPSTHCTRRKAARRTLPATALLCLAFARIPPASAKG